MLGPKHKNWGERGRPKEPHVEESFPPAVKLQIDNDVESGGFFPLSVAVNRVIEKDEWADVVDI